MPLRIPHSSGLFDLPLFVRYRQCQPRILVWTDLGGAYDPNSGFSLSQFVETLKRGRIDGRRPEVVTAHQDAHTSADRPSYRFDTGPDALSIKRFDVVFLFAIDQTPLPAAQMRDPIARFMQAGGGVFATGDHAKLGAMLGDIPRVRAMRRWNGPSASDENRLTTNVRVGTGSFEFNDQSDAVPQRVYLNYCTQAGCLDNPHPLMQGSTQPIEHIPDHPHEGECLIPTDLATTFELDGRTIEEWPQDASGPVAPELVALSVSHGGPIVSHGKDPVEPKSFIAIAAYDGHRAKAGRVVTDATWHHFININIDGTGASGYSGLQIGGVDTPELERIREHWENLADWLMPARRRRCLCWIRLLEELRVGPLYEDLPPVPLAKANAADLARVGALAIAGLQQRLRPFEVTACVDAAWQLAFGEARPARLDQPDPLTELAVDAVRRATLGGVVLGVVDALRDGRLPDAIEDLEAPMTRGGQRAVKIARASVLDRLGAATEQVTGIGVRAAAPAR